MTYILFALILILALLLIRERLRSTKLLDRFEKMLGSASSEFIADESLTPTERRLITRLRELETREARLQRGYANISSLVADIAHQSKTPLSSILMHAELNDCEALRAPTEKLAFLIESLTKLAKCEGGLIDENLAPKENSVKELVRLIAQANFASADEKSIVLECDVPSELSARFDLRWTAEAIGNILDNAIKYSPERSSVRISACAYELFVRIDIADQGDGIPEEELCNIRKRFYRGKNSEGKSGVGIGLYLAESILHAESGRLAVNSSPEGSVFSVFLAKV